MQHNPKSILVGFRGSVWGQDNNANANSATKNSRNVIAKKTDVIAKKTDVID
jgi:hypothetical protein